MKMKIRKEDHITYNNVPGCYLEVMEPIFQEQGFEYEILSSFEIPDDQPQAVFLEGKPFMICSCVKSNMNEDDFHKIVLSIWNPDKYGYLEDL